jgi:hypothetical protein
MMIIDRGKISEMTVAIQLLKMGWQVSLPFSDSCVYDLVTDSNDGMKRVQVKTVRLSDKNKYFLPLYKNGRGRKNASSLPREPYTKKEIDCVIGARDDVCYIADIFDKNSIGINNCTILQDHPWFKQKELS